MGGAAGCVSDRVVEPDGAWLQARAKVVTYGTISSRKPLRKSMGMSVICGIISSVGQYWWHKGVRYLAGGNALCKVSFCMRYGSRSVPTQGSSS